ncbi:hypothetical protein CJU90_6458 [Yarrowia sp. C11]|nr:hypothetical protein CJU90_6458 [Yarrowia sp. C11]KAG5371159.1 hypothetical protein CKK34_1299 [Yarrowia sp. E02]
MLSKDCIIGQRAFLNKSADDKDPEAQFGVFQFQGSTNQNVFYGQPTVMVPRDWCPEGTGEGSPSPAVCFHCFAVKSKRSHQGVARLLRCGGCGMAMYCRAECQKSDWTKHHKYECRIFSNWTTTLMPGVSLALIVRTAFAMAQDTGLRTLIFQMHTEGNYKSPTRAALKVMADEIADQLYKCFSDNTGVAIPESLLNSAPWIEASGLNTDQLSHMIMALKNHTLYVGTVGAQPHVAVFDADLAFVNHSCAPTAVMYLRDSDEGKHLCVEVESDTSSYSTEITLNYTMYSDPLHKINTIDTLPFDCDCYKCKIYDVDGSFSCHACRLPVGPLKSDQYGGGWETQQKCQYCFQRLHFSYNECRKFELEAREVLQKVRRHLLSPYEDVPGDLIPSAGGLAPMRKGETYGEEWLPLRLLTYIMSMDMVSTNHRLFQDTMALLLVAFQGAPSIFLPIVGFFQKRTRETMPLGANGYAQKLYNYLHVTWPLFEMVSDALSRAVVTQMLTEPAPRPADAHPSGAAGVPLTSTASTYAALMLVYDYGSKCLAEIEDAVDKRASLRVAFGHLTMQNQCFLVDLKRQAAAGGINWFDADAQQKYGAQFKSIYLLLGPQSSVKMKFPSAVWNVMNFNDEMELLIRGDASAFDAMAREKCKEAMTNA